MMQQIDHGMETINCDHTTGMNRVIRVTHALANRGKVLKEARKILRINPPLPAKVRVTTLTDRFNHTRTNQNKPTIRYLTAVKGVQKEAMVSHRNPFKLDVNASSFMFKTRIKKCDGSSPEGCRFHPMCSSPCLCRKRPDDKAYRETFNLLNACQTKEIVSNKILDRIHVPDVPIPLNKIAGGDPEYFNSTRGRPLKDIFNKYEANHTQRTIFFKRVFTDYLTDQIRKRQEKFTLDMQLIEDTLTEIDKATVSFGEYISNVNSQSAKLVEEQMLLERDRDEAVSRLEQHRGVINEAKNNMYRQENNLAKIIVCRDFLLKLSPISFQQQYAEDAVNSASSEKWAQQVFQLYDKYCRYNPEPGKDVFLDEGIKLFVSQIRSLAPPRIYFKHHWEFGSLLREMEDVCSRQVADLASINKMIAYTEQTQKDVNEYLKKREGIVKRGISSTKQAFADETVRAADLAGAVDDETATTLKEAVSGDVVLEVYGLIETLFYDIVSEGKSKLTVIEMMEAIEQQVDVQAAAIANMGPELYSHFEKKVKQSIARKEDQGAKDMKGWQKIARNCRRGPEIYSTPLIGRTWKIPNARSFLPLKKRREFNRKTTGRRTEHLQTVGICIREDVEEELKEFLRRRLDPEEDDETETEITPLVALGDSGSSSVGTDTIHKSLLQFPALTIASKTSVTDESLYVPDFDYDSQEELFEENYAKKERQGLVTGKRPSILYRIATLDDRFTVPVGEPITPRDRRHLHRSERTLHHPLSGL